MLFHRKRPRRYTWRSRNVIWCHLLLFYFVTRDVRKGFPFRAEASKYWMSNILWPIVVLDDWYWVPPTCFVFSPAASFARRSISAFPLSLSCSSNSRAHIAECGVLTLFASRGPVGFTTGISSVSFGPGGGPATILRTMLSKDNVTGRALPTCFVGRFL